MIGRAAEGASIRSLTRLKVAPSRSVFMCTSLSLGTAASTSLVVRGTRGYLRLSLWSSIRGGSEMTSARLRRLLVVVPAALAAGAVLVIAQRPFAQATTVTDMDNPSAEVCNPIPLITQTPVTAPGLQTPGTETTYALPDGSTLGSLTPPSGFDPAQATDAQLSAFGIPLPPSDPAALAAWSTVYGAPLNVQAPGLPAGPQDVPCVTSRYNTALSSPAWNGMLDDNSGLPAFRDVSGYFKIPHFTAVCAHASAHSIWDGMGGWGSNKIIQAGIDTSQSSVDAVYPWVEVYPRQGEINVKTPAAVPGNTYSVDTSYQASTDRAYWAMSNVTTRQETTWYEANSGAYWDGSHVEWVDERPYNYNLSHPVDGHFYYYRKSTSSTAWSNEYINNYAYTRNDAYEAGLNLYSSSPAALLGGYAYNGVTGSNDIWHACP